MEQTRYNKLLEEEFAKGGHIIAVGEILTQEAWDRIISGANFAADNFATEVAKAALDEVANELSSAEDSWPMEDPFNFVDSIKIKLN